MDPMNLAYVRLDDSMRILISGYLWKLSRSMVPTTTPGCASALISKWSRRFFVLRADSCLYFFKKEQVIKKVEAIFVMHATSCLIMMDILKRLLVIGTFLESLKITFPLPLNVTKIPRVPKKGGNRRHRRLTLKK